MKKEGRERLALETQRSEVLKPSLEEREVGASQVEGLKKKKGLDLGFVVDNVNIIFMHIGLGFMVDIIKVIKIGLYDGDMAGNHFLFNSILKLGKILVKVF